MLIIGGGVVGLWLLRDAIDSGLSAILIERSELGARQSGHSHAYIHQGHLYADRADLAEDLRDVFDTWSDFLGQHDDVKIAEGSFFGFEDPLMQEHRQAFWGSTNLPFEAAGSSRPLPDALLGGVVVSGLWSPEVMVNGSALLNALADGLQDYMMRTAAHDKQRIQFHSDGGFVTAASIPGQNGRIVVRPRVVVLAAGEENENLAIRAGAQRTTRGLQQIRKAHMLVVRGSADELPPLAGVFPDVGPLFIASRKVDRDVIWLISDGRSEQMSSYSDHSRSDARWWVPRILEKIFQISPTCSAAREELQWGVYEAPKSERTAESSDGLPHEDAIEMYGLENVFAAWPTKLTLAPAVSQRLLPILHQQVTTYGSAGTPLALSSAWKSSRMPPSVAPERWERTLLEAWRPFCGRYDK